MEIWKLASFVGAAFLLSLVFLYFVDVGSLLSALSQVNPFLYLFSVVLILFSIVFWGVRWRFYIVSDGCDIGLIEVLKITLVGLAINNLTPLARMGGEPIRAILLSKRHGIDYEHSLATVLADSGTFLVTHISFILLAFILLFLVISPPFWVVMILLFSIGLLFLALGGILGIYSDMDFIKSLISFLSSKIERLQDRNIIEKYDKFRSKFRECLNKKTVLKVFACAGMSRVLNVLAYFLIFLSVGYHIDLITLTAILGIVAMANSIPFTPGALGVYEGVFISAFALVGVPIPISAVVVLLQRLIWYWSTSLVGGSLGIYYGVDILR